MSNNLSKVPNAWEMGFKHGTVRSIVWAYIVSCYEKDRAFCLHDMQEEGIIPATIESDPVSYFSTMRNYINQKLKVKNVPFHVVKLHEKGCYKLVAI